MTDKIAKLVYDYTNNNKIADKEFIEKVVNYVSCEKDLSDYIKEIEVITENNKSNDDESDSYSISKGCLVIDNTKGLNSLKYTFSPIKNKILFYNLEVVLTILHELDHTLLNKEKETGIDNINVLFTKILYDIKMPKLGTLTEDERNSLSEDELQKLQKECLQISLLISKSIMKYWLYHDAAPQERRANINSYLELNDVLYYLNDTPISFEDIESIRLYEIKKFIKKCRYKYIINKNGITNSPSYDYIKKLYNEQKLSMIDIYDNEPIISYNKAREKYNLNERILYGLPLNSYELEQINRVSNPFKAYEKKLVKITNK